MTTFRNWTAGLAAVALLASPLAAQNAASGSPRVQGVPDGYGDPVQVTIVGADGSGAGSTAVTQSGTWNINNVSGTVSLPTGASTAARQDTANTSLTTINTTLGSPLQASGSLTNISGTISLPTGASTAAKQAALGTATTPSTDVITVQFPTSNIWSYAAATGGISNTTTAVTVKAAAGASVRNYITSLQYDFQAFTTATEFAVRDGAGGTVLWRGYIPASVAGIREVRFASPLQGTANTLLEVVTLTASGAGAVFVNVQGFTGS